MHAFGLLEPGVSLVCLHADARSAVNLEALLKGLSCAVLAIDGVDWNAELSPWPAQRVFRRQSDFAGRAPEHLERLVRSVLPEAEETLRLKPTSRAVAGYSMAGLFALYAACTSQVFDAAASVSGSMWFQGLDSFLDDARFVPARAYFSVGNREKLSRCAAFRTIEECTIRAAARLTARGAQTMLERNAGGHFDCCDERLARGVRWLEGSKYEGWSAQPEFEAHRPR